MDSTSEAELPKGEGLQQRRSFDLGCETYTPQMWMDDLELLRASGANRAGLPYPLHACATSGRADIVQFMLDRGHDKDESNDVGCTALHDAAVMGHMCVMEALLAAGADVSLRCHGGLSPLDRAAGRGHVNIARVLVEHGADTNAADTNGVTPLHRAAIGGGAEMVPLLRLSGAEVDKVNNRGRTPLHLAAVVGHAAATQALLTAGANVGYRADMDQLSALDQAAAHGHVDVVAVLVEHGADANEPGPNGRAALHHAASFGKVDAIRLLCLKGADVDMLSGLRRCTPLYLAVEGNFMDASQALLEAGADVSIPGDDSVTILSLAASEGHVEMARLLLERGADANTACDNGSTPLHIAATRDKPGIVSLLLLKGADADALNGRGRTPLQMAAVLGHSAAAGALLAGGADAQGGDGPAALITAIVHDFMDVLMVMIEHGVDVSAASGGGVTALHFASDANNTAAMELLLAAGADIEATVDGSRITPLFAAAVQSYVSAVVVLLKHGASVSHRCAAQQTPLHFAAAKAGTVGTSEVVDLLLRHGADEKAIDSDGCTPTDVLGNQVEEHNSVAADVEGVRQLLAKAPADRAWRRRSFLVLCRAHYPGGRVQLGYGSGHAYDIGIAKRTRGRAGASRAEAEWAGVASMLMGVGADPISLMGDGANIIFDTIVGFL